jgi:two-component system, sensor histidine kinase PdtaS
LKTLISFIIAIAIQTHLFAFEGKIDSLKNLIGKSASEPAKLKLKLELTKAHRFENIKLALQEGNQTLVLAKTQKNVALELEAALELAKIQIANGDYAKAIEILDSEILIAKKNKLLEKKVDCLTLLAYIYRRKGDPEKSQKLYDVAFALSNSIKYTAGLSDSEKGFGDLNERQGKYLDALDHYAKALKLAQLAKNWEQEMMILNATGIIYDYQGNLDKGLGYYLEALRLAETHGNWVKASDIAGNVASIQFYLENDDKALEYYEKAIALAKKTFNKNGQASAYQGVVTIYNRRKDVANAMKYAQLDLRLRLEMGDKRGLAYSYKNLGTVYQSQGDMKKAEEHYLLGLKFAEETDQKIKKAVLNLQLGRLMNNTDQPERAIPYLKKVIEITQEMDVLREESLANQDLATSYVKLGRMQEAFEAQKRFSELNEKLFTQDRNEQTIKMQTIYETKNRDEKIESLEKENELRAQVIKQSAMVRNLSFVGLGLLILLAALFYNRARLKQKTNAVLTEKNTEIEEQNEVIQASLTQKETLLREIHHRVKNNLQIISSLLNIQSSSVDDPSVLSSIKEGQSRVQAMSLIHQNLYQSEHINNVDIENYLIELVAYLSEMFAKDGKTVDIEVSAQKLEFDIDTAIPLGLIVNELVSNAYKYAFENQAKGNIKIGINALNDIDYELHVDDDGSGLPTDFDSSKSKSMGLKLVKILSKQLRGKFSSGGNNGASFVVLFKDLRAYQLK